MELNPLEVHGLSYSYNKHLVLDGVELEVRKGEIIGILGPNGCGKTTLLRNLNKNLSPEGGCVLMDGLDIADMPKKDIAKTMAVVPQTNEIRFSFTVREIVSMGRMPFQGLMDPESHSDAEIIDSAIEKVGLAHMKDRYISTMSGGERQRVMIARALAQTPEILLMDEPTLHLDISTQFEALDLVSKLSKENGMTVVIVSHDLPMVAKYCDRVAMIKDHKVMCCGTLEEVLTPDNMRQVFNVDAELGTDSKTGEKTVFLHGVARSD